MTRPNLTLNRTPVSPQRLCVEFGLVVVAALGPVLNVTYDPLMTGLEHYSQFLNQRSEQILKGAANGCSILYIVTPSCSQNDVLHSVRLQPTQQALLDDFWSENNQNPRAYLVQDIA